MYALPLRRPSLATLAVHAGAAPDPATGARSTPIYLTNGFAFASTDQAADIFALRQAGFSYSRGANPTTAALEKRVAALEGGTAAVAVGSGQAALLLILMTLLRSGEEYVSSPLLFGGSLTLMRRLSARYGLQPRFAAGLTPEAFAAAITPRTRAIVVESIVNPSGAVVDLEGIAAVARAKKIPLIVDNTLASPALLRPIAHGADIVFHSASKFLGGQGQAIGGIIVDAGRFDWAGHGYDLLDAPWTEYDDLVVAERFPETAFATACRLFGLRDLGPGLSPMNAFLILTGIETLPLRMARHCETARAVAAYLRDHPKVARVSYPGLPGQPGHALANRYCPGGCGSIFTIALKEGEAAALALIERLGLISHVVNVGEVKSLAVHPATTTHRTLPPAEKALAGVEPDAVRLSIGLEDAADLIADLAQALAG